MWILPSPSTRILANVWRCQVTRSLGLKIDHADLFFCKLLIHRNGDTNISTFWHLPITYYMLNRYKLLDILLREDARAVGLGGLGVTCSPGDPRFADPAEVDGYFQDVKFLSTSPPGGTSSWGSRVWDFRLVKEPQAWKNRPLSKFNRHIHVLVIPKFGRAQ